ncbi:hypothetical protein D9M68_488200 [compost metagenome]
MGRRRTRGHQRRADRTGVRRELLLQPVQRREEGLEGAAIQRFAGRVALVGLEGFEAAGLVDAFGMIGEEHRISVEGDTQLVAGRPSRAAGQDGGGGKAALQGPAHVFGVGGQEQVATEGTQVGFRATPANEGRAGDAKAIVLDGIERAQAGVGAVARHQDDLHPRLAELLVQAEQFLHQRIGITGLQHLVLVLDLVLAVGFYAFRLVDPMAFVQVEQRPRGNRQYQLVIQPLAHGGPPLSPGCVRR